MSVLMKNLVRVVSAVALICVAIVLPAASASAHTATLTASWSCQADGTYKVTFTGSTANVPAEGDGHTATLNISNVEPAGSQASGAPATVVGNTTYTFTVIAPGTSKSVKATANLTWGDGQKASATGVTSPYGDCTKKTAAVAWTVQPPTCDTDGALVPASQPTGITASQSPSGTGPGTYTITFTAQPGYTNTGIKTQTLTVLPQLTGGYCLTEATPVSPTITVATCTGPGQSSTPSFTLAPNGGGISYSADGLVVTAVADSSHKFVNAPAGWTIVNEHKATFTVTYPDPGECLVVIQYEAPTPRDLCDSPPTWDEFPDVEHAIFSLLPNGNAVLTALAGYVFPDGRTSITFELPADTFEKCPVTPVAPEVTQSTCVDGTGTTPTVTPAVTEHLSYVVADDLTSVTATPGVGFEIVLEGTTGWVLNDDGTATYAVTLETPDCDVPVIPSVTTNDDCYTALDTVTLSEGVGYTGVDNGDGTATFTADDGYYFDDDGEHVTTIVLTYTPNTDEQCDLIPGDLAAQCVSAVPYLAYAVDLPPGFETDDATPMTITFVNPDGEDYVKANLPLKGKILWPGAKATAPQQWPGWSSCPTAPTWRPPATSPGPARASRSSST